MQVKCPTCGRRGEWFAGPYGPFCSRRCRLIDLGKWLNEEHAIQEPIESVAPDEIEELTQPQAPPEEQTR